MSPIYEHRCELCDKIHDFFRPISLSSVEERCPTCNGQTQRVYSATTPQEFPAYYDEKFKREVRTGGQERKLMKKHKQVYTKDVISSFRNYDQIKPILEKKRWNMKRGIAV